MTARSSARRAQQDDRGQKKAPGAELRALGPAFPIPAAYGNPETLKRASVAGVPAASKRLTYMKYVLPAGIANETFSGLLVVAPGQVGPSILQNVNASSRPYRSRSGPADQFNCTLTVMLAAVAFATLKKSSQSSAGSVTTPFLQMPERVM